MKLRFEKPVIALFSLWMALAPGLAMAGPLDINDLGFTPAETQGNEKIQFELEKRGRMLKTHQILGLVTAVPMWAALFTGHSAKQDRAGRDMHMAVGLSAGAMYFTTAGFAFLAPEPPKEKKSSGATKWHRRMAYVHFPAMVAAPILGLQAKHQRDRGDQTLHGAAKLHPTVATIAAVGFTAALAVMTVNIRF